MEQSTIPTKETVKELFIRLSTTTTSDELDSTVIQLFLRRIGYPKAIVTSGIVYLSGYGYPQSIHTIAKTILEALDK